MFGRRKVAMVVAEFLGTGLLALVMLSVQRSTIGIPYFVAIAGGLAVTALMFVLSTVSGAHFNPAITIGLWTARKVKSLPALVYLVAQLLGGWAAYGVYTYFVNSSLQKLGGHFTWRVFLAEAVGTMIFGLVWAAVAARRLSYAVAGVGFTLGVIVAAAASIGLINPAVAISARAWEVFSSTGWLTYALAPVVGAAVGINLYNLLFDAPEAVAAAAAPAARPAAAARVTTTRRAAPARKTTATRKRK